MKMMRERPSYGAVARILAVGGLTAVTFVAPLFAQSGGDRQDCRCVDSAGKEIANCTCLRLPSSRSMALVFPERDHRARLGITVSTSQSSGDDAKGARVESVLEDGPAAEAGIREGDIITRVDGKSLLAPLGGDAEKGIDPDESVPVQRLLAITKDLEPDQKVPVTYLRDGKSHNTTVETKDLTDRMGIRVFADSTMRVRMRDLRQRMGRLNDSMRGLAPRIREYRFVEPRGDLRIFGDSAGAPNVLLRGWFPDSTRHALRLDRFDPADRCPGADRADITLFGDDCPGGAQLVALNPGLAGYFGTDKGVLVSDVRADSPIGLQAGDVILQIGSRSVTSPEQVRRILRSYSPDETITFRIMRKGKSMSVSGHRATG